MADADAPTALQSPQRSAHRNAIRADPHDISRRRAMSEVVQTDLSTGRWRIVGAWSSLRRSHCKRLVDEHAPVAPPTPAGESPHTIACYPPRKRISLFLRRRRTAAREDAPHPDPALVLEPAMIYRPPSERDEHQPLRRARSHRLAPSARLPPDPDADRTDERKRSDYSATMDDGSVETLKDISTAAMRGLAGQRALHMFSSDSEQEEVQVAAAAAAEATTTISREAIVDVDVDVDVDTEPLDESDGRSDEIIGEICLEDFADVGSDDFEFLENQSVDMAGIEPGSVGRLSRLPSLKLDSQKLRWIGNEAEFAAFFAEVGLDDWFDVDVPVDMKLFDVGDDVFAEWNNVGLEHNRYSSQWQTLQQQQHAAPSDIRQLEADFSAILRRRDVRQGWERRVAMYSR